MSIDTQKELQEVQIALSNIIEEFVQGNFQAGKNPYAVPMLTDAMKLLAKQAGVKDYMETHVVKERLEQQMEEHFKWRLPTKEELGGMYKNRGKIGGFDKSSWYWSSTKNYSDNAYNVDFRNGCTYTCRKYNYYRVRCARSLPFNNLIISKNASIGERFELNGEEVVFAGVDEGGYALIVAAHDEPNPMTWDEAMQAAEARNQRQEQDQEAPKEPVKKAAGPKM